MPEKPFDSLALVLDLETTAIPNADQFLEPPTAPSNYKDTEKIKSYVAEKTAQNLTNCSLDPDLNRIVALGFMLEDRDLEPLVYLCPDEAAERKALITFWDVVACDGNRTRRLVTFNGFAFDLPTLMRRSVYLDIWPSRDLSVDRYRSPHVDLLQKLSFNGAIKAHSLSFYAQRFGFEIETPEWTGADIAGLVEAGNWDAIKAHCRSDVLLTFELAQRLRYVAFDEDAHDEAVRSERRSA